MAVTATIHTPPPPPALDTRVVTLSMPYDVAVSLERVLAFVSGDPDTTYRRHTADIKQALASLGVQGNVGTRFSGSTVAHFIKE